MNGIGFWEPNQDFQPITDPTFKGTHEYYAVLKLLGDRSHKRIMYRGMSKCRICGIYNGAEDVFVGPFVIPSGYAHYIEAHSIKPPQELIDLALQEA